MPILSHPIILNLERILQHLKQNIFGKVCNPTLLRSNQKNVLELLYVQFLRLCVLDLYYYCYPYHSYCYTNNQLEFI